MDLTGILLGLLVLTTLLIFKRPIIDYWQFMGKIKKLPTTRCNFLLGHVWEVLGPRNKMVERAMNVIKRTPSSSVIWIGPIPTLAIHHAKHLEVILGSRKYIDRSMVYSFIEPWVGNGLLLSTGSKWHSRRKMLTPAFHFSILENFIEVFADKSRVLVEKLRKEVSSEKFDVTPYITMCTLDIICETAMGVEINAQELREELKYVKAACNITEQGITRFISPWLYPDIIFNLFPCGRRFKKYCETLHEFTNKIIKQKRQDYLVTTKKQNFSEEHSIGKKKKMAFLDLLLEYSENEGLTDEDIRGEIDTIMFAGHDTTTSAISWTLQMLASHVDVQNRVRKEIESIFQGSHRPANSKDLNEMKYIERVIKETLRLYPSVPLFGRCINEDFEIDGNIIPAGIMIGFPIYHTHRNPEYFPDPEKFNPDNFLPERVVDRHPYAYIPFSAGPRNCIGQKFAMLEMKMVLSSILRHYELHATGEIPIPIPQVVLKPENGVQLRITPRTSFI